MKCVVLVIGFLILSLTVQSQESYNVVCADFTYHEESFEDGKGLRKLFETALSKSEGLFKLLKRDNLDALLLKIQEEKNLQWDFNKTPYKNELILAGAQFVVFGNITKKYGKDECLLQIEFVRIDGKETLEKIPLSILIKESELTDYRKCGEIFNREVTNFVKEVQEKRQNLETAKSNKTEKKVKIDSIPILNLRKTELDIKLQRQRQYEKQLKNYTGQPYYYTRVDVSFKTEIVLTQLMFAVLKEDVFLFDVNIRGGMMFKQGGVYLKKYPLILFNNPFNGAYRIEIYSYSPMEDIYKEIISN